MGLRLKEFIFFALLIVLVLLLKSSAFPDGSARFGSFKTGSASQFHPVESHGGFRGDNEDHEDGDDPVGLSDDKRKIYTGPNPLHNR